MSIIANHLFSGLKQHISKKESKQHYKLGAVPVTIIRREV